MLYFTGYTLSVSVLPSKRSSVAKARLYLTVSSVPLLTCYLRAKITREEEKSWNPHTLTVTSERANVKNHVYMWISRVNAKDHVDYAKIRVNAKDRVDMWMSRVNAKDHVEMQISRVNAKDHVDVAGYQAIFFPLKSFLSH